jgi:predicted flap endonuclease-1-like 5' DNA nuclease
MYEHFNPFGLPGAWWQHLLMLVVSAILGYIIGYRSRKGEIESLEAELSGLDVSLDDCLRNKKVAFVAPIATPDDLKIVEGIGPKIEELFNNNGILTFAKLAATDSKHLREILVNAGPNYQIHDPTTWPQQSALARDGKWDELKAWQDELYKGRPE